MNFIDWMNMNMFIDISFIVFAIAVIWKMRVYKNKISYIETEMKSFSIYINEHLETHKLTLLEMHENIVNMNKTMEENDKIIEAIEDRVTSVIKNPQKARRDLKK